MDKTIVPLMTICLFYLVPLAINFVEKHPHFSFHLQQVLFDHIFVHVFMQFSLVCMFTCEDCMKTYMFSELQFDFYVFDLITS